MVETIKNLDDKVQQENDDEEISISENVGQIDNQEPEELPAPNQDNPGETNIQNQEG